LAARNIRGHYLLERLLYELKYFAETGKHLDIDNLTLCSGSRDLLAMFRASSGAATSCASPGSALPLPALACVLVLQQFILQQFNFFFFLFPFSSSFVFDKRGDFFLQ
jgi:hypothetical protein